MDIDGFITLFSGGALLAAKPGPGMITVATKAMSEGVKSVLYFMVGSNLVKILFFTLVVFGYSLIPDKVLIVTVLLKALTAAYLIGLGVQGWSKPEVDTQAHETVLKKTGFSENFLTGFMVTISNPFDILFFAAILPTILEVSTMSVAQYILCALVIVAADALVALSYAVPIALSRRFIARAVVRRLNLVSSLGLILVGLYIGYTAFPNV